MALSQQVITETINGHVTKLLADLDLYTPQVKYGVAVAFAYVPGGYNTYYCFGSADAQGTPVTEATIFSIGSLTKTFTAVLLANTTYNQNLDVNYADPVTKYLSDYLNGASAGTLMQQITLLDLAQHTSGLRDPTLSEQDGIGLFLADPSSPPSDLTRFWKNYNVGDGPTPNTCWEYSDLGFVTLGYALVAANKYSTYAALLSDVITTPLNMPSTAATVSRDAPVALGHHNGIPVEATGSPDLKSNLADMYQWTLQNLRAPTIQNPDNLMQSLAATTTMNDLGVPLCPGVKGQYLPAYMGMAWEGTAGADASPKITWKDGLTTLGGCSCWVGLIPANPAADFPGLGIAILVNGWVEDGNVNVVADTTGSAILKDLYAAYVS